MKESLRQQLAREPFEEKIRKVGQLVRLAKTFPKRTPDSHSTAASRSTIATATPK